MEKPFTLTAAYDPEADLPSGCSSKIGTFKASKAARASHLEPPPPPPLLAVCRVKIVRNTCHNEVYILTELALNHTCHCVPFSLPVSFFGRVCQQVDVPEGSGVAKVRVNVKHDVHGMFSVQSAELMKEVVKVLVQHCFYYIPAAPFLFHTATRRLRFLCVFFLPFLSLLVCYVR